MSNGDSSSKVVDVSNQLPTRFGDSIQSTDVISTLIRAIPSCHVQSLPAFDKHFFPAMKSRRGTNQAELTVC